MARKLRVEYPGAIYHVMNRGDRREAIFKDDKDRELFLETLGESSTKTGWQFHPLCLLGNHFRLVVKRRRPTFALIRLIARLSLQTQVVAPTGAFFST